MDKRKNERGRNKENTQFKKVIIIVSVEEYKVDTGQNQDTLPRKWRVGMYA
jgi:hypothetical protein